MRAYHIDRAGSLDGLVYRESLEDRAPGNGEVLVEIRAASINQRDLAVLYDRYTHGIRPGLVPLSDSGGEVIAVGHGVSRFRVGDRVVTNVLQRWVAGERLPHYSGSGLGGSWDGVLRERGVFPEDGLLPMPGHLSFREGAAFGLSSLAAWSALTRGKSLRAGDAVLIQGSGNVSLFALQFARLLGARVIALTGEADKVARLRELGAEMVIDRSATPEWTGAVLDHTGGKGVDRIVDVVGPAMLAQSLGVLAMNGQLSLVGMLGGARNVDISPLLRAALTIEGIGGGSCQEFAQLLDAVRAAQLRPVIHRVFDFADAPMAFMHMQADRFGKTIIRMTYDDE